MRQKSHDGEEYVAPCLFLRFPLSDACIPADLAVIFRPGIMSHPSHELSPKEHQLSQEVLEFLIAHQDWFMLDIPPPPAKAKTSAAGEEMDDMALVSSSDDDRSTVGGWKLVGGRSEAEKRKIARRRTTTERERERLRIGEDSLLTR